MAAKSSKALTKRSRETDLMPPPPPPKRIRRPQKVLDEETYVSGISEIIARDFFPGLLETETQQEYLDALESQDKSWIRSAGSRLTQIMTPGRNVGRRGTSIQTPVAGSETPRGYGGDTPMSVASDVSMASTQMPSVPVMNTKMSLDSFQATYTSEDNESFYKLLDKQNRKRTEKYSWLWGGNKLPSNRLLKQKEVETKLLESMGSLKDDGGDKSRLAIQDLDEKPAMPDSWNAKPNNNFMFGPDGIEDSVQTIAQQAQAESRAAPKGVAYSNTRMPLPDLDATPEIPPSPSLAAVRDAIAGRPHRPDSELGFNGNQTPRINGYAFVDDEPEPHEYDPPVQPVILGKGDATPNPFNIKHQSKREDLHHRMVDNVAKAKRNSQKIGATGKVEVTPVPKFPSSPRVSVGGLTPAAQRLWSKVGSSGKTGSHLRSEVRTPISIMKSDKSKLRVAWTPK